MSDALLGVERLNAGDGEMAVLRDITLEIARGEIVALVGSNGAGKTTLLRALSRLIPSTGRITFAGHALDKAHAGSGFQSRCRPGPRRPPAL